MKLPSYYRLRFRNITFNLLYNDFLESLTVGMADACFVSTNSMDFTDSWLYVFSVFPGVTSNFFGFFLAGLSAGMGYFFLQSIFNVVLFENWIDYVFIRNLSPQLLNNNNNMNGNNSDINIINNNSNNGGMAYDIVMNNEDEVTAIEMMTPFVQTDKNSDKGNDNDDDYNNNEKDSNIKNNNINNNSINNINTSINNNHITLSPRTSINNSKSNNNNNNNNSGKSSHTSSKQ
jgi:hypothetical protein